MKRVHASLNPFKNRPTSLSHTYREVLRRDHPAGDDFRRIISNPPSGVAVGCSL
jgi:hypothetical protein